MTATPEYPRLSNFREHTVGPHGCVDSKTSPDLSSQASWDTLAAGAVKSSQFLIFIFAVLRVETWASCMLGKGSVRQLHPVLF